MLKGWPTTVPIKQNANKIPWRCMQNYTDEDELGKQGGFINKTERRDECPGQLPRVHDMKRYAKKKYEVAKKIILP